MFSIFVPGFDLLPPLAPRNVVQNHVALDVFLVVDKVDASEELFLVNVEGIHCAKSVLSGKEIHEKLRESSMVKQSERSSIEIVLVYSAASPLLNEVF